ncbi:MAG TPA: permease-like cell division protein FtsX [Ferrovaceae bacterium]|nr:permease-like cell division protein FtsX [Ferrovaceae bacterium]
MNLSRDYGAYADDLLHNIHAVIFLNTSASTTDVTQLRQILSQEKNVIHTEFIAKEAGLLQLKQDPNLRDILTHIHNNPIPDAVIVTLATRSSQDLQITLKSWQALGFIHTVNIDLPWIERTIRLRDFINHLATVFMVVMGLLLSVLLISAIRHYHLNSQDERYIALCFGATPGQLLLPLLEIILIETTLIIFLGVLMSWAILNGLHHGFENIFFTHLTHHSTAFNSKIFVVYSLVLIVLSIVLTLLISYFSTARNPVTGRR